MSASSKADDHQHQRGDQTAPESCSKRSSARTYRTGYLHRNDTAGRTWDQAEPELKTDWERNKDASRLQWDQARSASRAAWDRAGMPG